MIETVRDRATITRKVLELLPANPALLSAGEYYDDCLRTWWFVPNSSTNLRLSVIGDQAFRLAGLEYKDLPYSTVPGPTGMFTGFSFITSIGRIECPFYVAKSIDRIPQIRIYDSRVAMMMVLHGNVLNYLASQKRHAK